MATLIACEESGRVTAALRRVGIEAYSCDLLPTSGGHPEWHIRTDVRLLLRHRWDAVIAFPPCTYLSTAGARYWREWEADGRQDAAVVFFMDCVNANAQLVAVENPTGIMSRLWRKPDQIINPWQFGHKEAKRTCLWLRGLPPLWPTDIMPVDEDTTSARWFQNMAAGPRRSIRRSKTFAGIAAAMADQWGPHILTAARRSESAERLPWEVGINE